MARSHRIWFLGVLLGGALILSACLPPDNQTQDTATTTTSTTTTTTRPPPPPPPPPPPLASQDCLSSAPSSAAQYQQLFDNRGTIWDAADSTAVLSRTGQSTVWLFGDTYAGRVNPDGSLGAGWQFVNNSILSESGSCLTPHLGGAALTPHELFQDPGDGSWYWPGGGVVNSDGSMQVMLIRVQNASTSDPNVQFGPIGVAVARVNADLSVQSITSIPSAWVAGDSAAPVRPYGGAVTTDGTYAYLYTFAPEPAALNQFVARVPLNKLTTGPWEYSMSATPKSGCTRSWSTHPTDAWPMEIPNPALSLDPKDNLPLAAFHVTPYKGGYLAVAKGSDIATSNANLNKIYVWTSASADGPWLPFTGPIVGLTLPANNTAGEWSYGAKLVSTANAGLIVTWNVNAPSSQVYLNVHHYGPRFAAPSTLP